MLIQTYSQTQFLLKAIVEAQLELQAIRQLLNQQINFSLKGSFIAISESQQKIDLFQIKGFLKTLTKIQGKQEEISDEAIQSMIKFYSDGNLGLDLDAWGKIVLCREDYLLRKIAGQRQDQEGSIPMYLLNFIKKLVVKQAILHGVFLKYQSSQNWKHLKAQTSEGVLTNERLKLLYGGENKECSEEQIEILKRYLWRGELKMISGYPLENLKFIFNRCNSNKINGFLHSKNVQYNQKENLAKKTNESHPFTHQQFRKLKGKIETSAVYNIRLAKSIQNHLHRNHIVTSQKLIKNIKNFREGLQKDLNIFFKTVDKILKLNQKIVAQKHSLLQKHECNFNLIFTQISKNKIIIPSQLHHYFSKFSITIPLSSIFLLFKRYCDPITGKLSQSNFKRIFKLSSTPQQKKGDTILSKFRVDIVSCLLKQIQLESKIERQKRQLLNRVDLRQIFQVIDHERIKKISQIDYKILYKKIRRVDIFSQYLNELWWRMNSRQDQYINYDEFMYEMIPRVRVN